MLLPVDSSVHHPASSSWKSLSQEEKQRFQESAKQFNKHKSDPQALTEDEKKREAKRLLAEILTKVIFKMY